MCISISIFVARFQKMDLFQLSNDTPLDNHILDHPMGFLAIISSQMQDDGRLSRSAMGMEGSDSVRYVRAACLACPDGKIVNTVSFLSRVAGPSQDSAANAGRVAWVIGLDSMLD